MRQTTSSVKWVRSVSRSPRENAWWTLRHRATLGCSSTQSPSLKASLVLRNTSCARKVCQDDLLSLVAQVGPGLELEPGVGVADAVVMGLGEGEGVAVGCGVGAGVGSGVGAGVGSGVGGDQRPYLPTIQSHTSRDSFAPKE